MSTLVADADESATLEATLAFLDNYDAVSTTDNGPFGATQSPPPPTACLTPQQKQQQDHHSPAAAATPVKRNKNRKYPNSSSTVLQRRKKAEIVALRTLVEQLEEQLAQLKRVPGSTNTLRLIGDYEDNEEEEEEGALMLPTNWADHAALQFRGRLKAEKTNSKLKRLLANQIKVSQALRTLLQKTSAMENMEFLHPAPCRPLPDNVYGMEMLEQHVQNLYLCADATFQPLETMESISVQAVVKQNQGLGKTVEIRSSTPMMRSLQTASDTLWNWLSLVKPLRDRPNILERNYTLLLESQIGALEFKKQNFVRRYEEKDRVVVVWADILSLPKYQMRFRNQGWVFITPSVDDPKEASVLRTFQQIFVDYGESHMMQGASFAEESAFRELSNLYRRYVQSQQNMMMEETRPAVLMAESMGTTEITV